MARADKFIRLLEELNDLTDRARKDELRTVVVTFDLKQNRYKKYDYDAAYEVLATFGLDQTSLKKGLSLPQSTVLGKIRTRESAASLRDKIKARFKRKGVAHSRIFVAFVGKWGAAANR